MKRVSELTRNITFLFMFILHCIVNIQIIFIMSMISLLVHKLIKNVLSFIFRWISFLFYYSNNTIQDPATDFYEPFWNRKLLKIKNSYMLVPILVITVPTFGKIIKQNKNALIHNKVEFFSKWLIFHKKKTPWITIGNFTNWYVHLKYVNLQCIYVFHPPLKVSS